MESLRKCPANFVALSPVSFLERTAVVYAHQTSVIYGHIKFTWAQTFQRCRSIASFLVQRLNVGRGDVVSVLAPNIPALYEMHFAVPMAGAVLNAINTRLDARSVATILGHAHAKLLFVDYQFLPLAQDALALTRGAKPLLVPIHELGAPSPGGAAADMEYEHLVRMGDARFQGVKVEDEWESVALNYTSGTTSAPKGVAYSHRGAYLSTLSALLLWQMEKQPVFLWTLPMFHCNGWTFTWGVAARGGTNVCIRNVTAQEVYGAINQHGVTHMCCAPIVFNILINENHRRCDEFTGRRVHILTGGAPPPPALVSRVEEMGFCVTHAYGLTEATGPALVCEWKAEWDALSAAERNAMKGRQGVNVISLAEADVKDPATMCGVPRDGRSLGEVMLRGSSLMKGYLRDPDGTARAFADGWFHTGDVGVVHPDGYIEIKDRSKDVIISGGENISSVEVESVLYSHPLVTEAAVVAMPHPHWGETPCAFLHVTRDVKEAEMVSFCRERLPHYMVPKTVVFMEGLPKTSTGKIQKFILRDMAKNLSQQPSEAVPRKKAQASQQQRRRRPQCDHDQDHHGLEHNYVAARCRL